MEIPSPAAGVVREMRVKTGDKVSQGSPILILEEAESASVAPAKPAPKLQEAPTSKPAPALAAVAARASSAPGEPRAASSASPPALGTLRPANPPWRDVAQ